jgi:hypothetical protein
MTKITFSDRVTFMVAWWAQNANNPKKTAPVAGLKYLTQLALVHPDYPNVMRDIRKQGW